MSTTTIRTSMAQHLTVAMLLEAQTLRTRPIITLNLNNSTLSGKQHKLLRHQLLIRQISASHWVKQQAQIAVQPRFLAISWAVLVNRILNQDRQMVVATKNQFHHRSAINLVVKHKDTRQVQSGPSSEIVSLTMHATLLLVPTRTRFAVRQKNQPSNRATLPQTLLTL